VNRAKTRKIVTRQEKLLQTRRFTTMTDNEVILKYDRLVFKIARKYQRQAEKTRVLEYGDLVNIGLMALVKANQKFDLSFGRGFLGYAWDGIENEIRGEIKRKEHRLNNQIPIMVEEYQNLYSNDHEKTEKRAIIGLLFKELDAQDKNVIERHYINGEDQTRIAVDLGISKQALSRKIQKIVKKMKKRGLLVDRDGRID
jgi:RNA polymerase sigma factor (sigma-70 family)